MTTMMNDYIRDMLSTYFNFNTTNIKDHIIIFVITILIINATTFIYVIKILLTTRPLPITSENGKRILKPYGSTYGKNYFAYFMAYIAKLRERKKAYKMSLKQLEAFHKPDIHKYWNESYYFNGSESGTNNRFISRISRHGLNAKEMYIVLILDLNGYGILSLEEDHVPVVRKKNKNDDDDETDEDNTNTNYIYENPSGLNLTYTCIEPMKKWRIEYKGMLTQGYKSPEEKKKEDNNTNNKQYVEIDLTYTNQSDTFWYMRDENQMTLAKNLSEEPWGYSFFKYCLERSHNHCHIETFGTLSGHIKMGDGHGHKFIKDYTFNTFRDHSWDIRNWAAIDSMYILLIYFNEPLRINNVEYDYFDLTLVDMPGNINGVQSFTTGYFSSKHGTIKNLPISHATSIRELPIQMSKKYKNESGHPTREPSCTKNNIIDIHINDQTMIQMTIQCKGIDLKRRGMYFPDNGRFHLFEDNITKIIIDDFANGYGITGYGTRQIGYRATENVDLSGGGVG